MVYRHSYRVHAPLAAVADFHARPASMASVTPPPLVMRLHPGPNVLHSGDRMAFTLWMGPLPVHWVAAIEDASGEGFADRQLHGPFAEWRHRHTFRPLGARVTAVDDEVTASLRRHPLWGPIGLAMWAGLPMLFAFRGWKTRRILERLS